jgi:hypothetical protein
MRYARRHVVAESKERITKLRDLEGHISNYYDCTELETTTAKSQESDGAASIELNLSDPQIKKLLSTIRQDLIKAYSEQSNDPRRVGFPLFYMS